MSVEFVRFETEKRAGDALYNEIRRYLVDAPGYNEADSDGSVGSRTATSPFVVMLAGGSTPMGVYHRLAEEPPNRLHPAAHVMVSDDRYVPIDDPRSNVGNILPTTHALGLPDTRFIHVDATLPIEEAVAGYARRIRTLAARHALFALGILGIGADGHTASLFSADMVDSINGRETRTVEPGSGVLLTEHTYPLALHTGRHDGVERVSAGTAVLLSFRKLIFFATGAGKRDVLYEISRRPEGYAAGRLLLQHPNAYIWTDEAPRVG